MDRSHPGRKEMLDHINLAALAHGFFDNRSDHIHVPKQISKAISFVSLRRQMDRFLRVMGVQPLIVDNARWRNFIQLLIEVLIDSPLENASKDFPHVKVFAFVKKSDLPRFSGDEEAVACWKVICRNGATFYGPVNLQSL